METFNGIGLKEQRDDTSFLLRHKERKKNPTICPEKNYEWGEYKSSLLVQYMLNNSKIQTILNTFVLNYIEKFYKIYKSSNFTLDFAIFLLDAKDSGSQYKGKNSANHYPVGQSQIIGNGNQEFDKLICDPVKLNNVVIFSSFMASRFFFGNNEEYSGNILNVDNSLQELKKNIRIVNKLLNEKYSSENAKNSFFQIINILQSTYILQQKTMLAQFGIKGNRFNRNLKQLSKEGKLVKTKQVGISRLYEPDDKDIPELKGTEFEHGLRRTITGLNQYVEPWAHPGIEQCRVPHWGKWGQHMKDNLEKNRLIASEQCGLSGSVLFQLYSYLYAHTTSPILNPKQDFENLVLTSVLTLVGDGGHNIMEVVYGYVFSIIILYNILVRLKEELEQLYKKGTLEKNVSSFLEDLDKLEYDELLIKLNSFNSILLVMFFNQIWSLEWNDEAYFVNDKTTTFYDDNSIVMTKLFIQNWVNWDAFITEAYKQTSTFNITGISEEDLNEYNSSLIRDWDASYYGRLNLISLVLNNPMENKEDPFYNDSLQIAMAMDNNRYKGGKKSWENSPTEFILNILKNYDDGSRGLSMINKELSRKMNSCDFDDYNPTAIPFAFPKPKKSNSRHYKAQ
jgi:hypothetical protein